MKVVIEIIENNPDNGSSKSQAGTSYSMSAAMEHVQSKEQLQKAQNAIEAAFKSTQAPSQKWSSVESEIRRVLLEVVKNVEKSDTL